MIYDDAERRPLRRGGREHHLPAPLPERRARQLRVELRRQLQQVPSRGTRSWASSSIRRLSYTGLRMRAAAVDERSRSASCPQRDHFQLEMDHFSECVQANKEPLTPGEEGLKDLRIIEAVYRSASADAPVKLV